MEPITVKSSIDLKTYFKLVLSLALNYKVVLIIVCFFAFLTIPFWESTANHTENLTEIGLMLLLFAAIFPGSLWLASKKSMKKQPLLAEGATYKIDNATITYQTQSTSGSNDWKLIKKVKETKTHFLLFTSFNAFHFLSKDGFSSAGDLERFKQMVKANNIVAYFR